MKSDKDQLLKFVAAARELGTDEDPAHFKPIVLKLAKANRPYRKLKSGT